MATGQNVDRISTKAEGMYNIIVGATDCFYTSIQSAIDAAAEGDKIYIKAGTYVGNIIINKELLNIYSDCMDDCTIIGDGITPTISIMADDVAISNLSIVSAPGASAIFLENVRDCKFNYCSCIGGKNGIELINVDDCILSNITVVGNTEYGIKLTDCEDNVLSDCFATTNTNGYGIFNSTLNRVFDSAAYQNTNIGFRFVNITRGTLNTNMSQYNAIGVSFESSDINTFINGSIGWNGIGLQFIDSDYNTMYSTPITFSTAKALIISSGSISNNIVHNFFDNELVTDLGTNTYFSNNHIDYGPGTTAIPRESDVATVGYVDALIISGSMFELDENGDIQSNIGYVSSSIVLFELDENGNIQPKI